MAKADLKIELVMASIRHWLARNEQEYNVIEAAKAAEESLIYYVGDTGSVLVGDLVDALEALEGVERD